MAIDTKLDLSQSRWAAAAFAVVAYLSLHKFAGLSGALGSAGWLLMAATVYRQPAVLVSGVRTLQTSRGAVIAIAVALLLVVGSVVVWAIER